MNQIFCMIDYCRLRCRCHRHRHHLTTTFCMHAMFLPGGAFFFIIFIFIIFSFFCIWNFKNLKNIYIIKIKNNVKCTASNVPPNAPYVIYTDANGQVQMLFVYNCFILFFFFVCFLFYDLFLK